jgi:hypothetical protein
MNASKVTNNSVLYYLWYVLVFSILIPKLTIGFLTLGTDDLIGLVFLPYTIYIILKRHFSMQIRINRIILIWFGIIILGIFLSIFHSLILMNSIKLPTEMWQYIKRLVYFFLVIKIVSDDAINAKEAIKTFVFMLFVLLIIGVLQTTNTSIGMFLSKIYVTELHQLEALKEADSSSLRNYSVTGFSTSWGGLCVFIASVAIAFVLNINNKPRKLFGRLYLLLILGLSLMNILWSGSRAAILAMACVVVSVILILMFNNKINLKTRFKNLIIIILIVVASLGSVFTFMQDKVLFIQYRNEALLEAYEDGGNRFGDVDKAMTSLSNPYWWLFGVGNAVQRGMYVPYGVEVEPIYLLVNYGLVGIGLRYLLLLMIVIKSYELYLYPQRFGFDNSKAIGFSGIIAIVGFMTFSVGYFFFQEAVVGCQPWIWFGLIVGIKKIA